eukprot:Tamp_16912.p1 GENE.Tamp_16912~~Tamp_16912.p1  ORF type:complete len:306 (+),score=35.65 Tamp_16912:92-919(+)
MNMGSLADALSNLQGTSTAQRPASNQMSEMGRMPDFQKTPGGLDLRMVTPAELLLDPERTKNMTADDQRDMIQQLYNEQAEYQRKMAQKQFEDQEREIQLYQKQMAQNAKVLQQTQLSQLSQQLREIKEQREETINQMEVHRRATAGERVGMGMGDVYSLPTNHRSMSPGPNDQGVYYPRMTAGASPGAGAFSSHGGQGRSPPPFASSPPPNDFGQAYGASATSYGGNQAYGSMPGGLHCKMPSSLLPLGAVRTPILRRRLSFLTPASCTVLNTR